MAVVFEVIYLLAINLNYHNCSQSNNIGSNGVGLRMDSTTDIAPLILHRMLMHEADWEGSTPPKDPKSVQYRLILLFVYFTG